MTQYIESTSWIYVSKHADVELWEFIADVHFQQFPDSLATKARMKADPEYPENFQVQFLEDGHWYFAYDIPKLDVYLHLC